MRGAFKLDTKDNRSEQTIASSLFKRWKYIKKFYNVEFDPGSG